MPVDIDNMEDIALGEVIAKRYELKSVINPNNGEATVYVCDYDSWICLAKIYQADKLPSKEKIDKIKALDSPYIVKKLDNLVYKKHYCEIMPMFTKADLLTSGNPITDKSLITTIIPDIMEALKIIHEAGLVHGNVKPTNIFYNALDFDVLLGDFGVSIENVGDCGNNIDIGYLPPEVINGVFGKEADYYSLGVSLVHLVTGRNPFEGMTKKQMLKTAATIEFDIPEKVSPQVKNIIRGLTIKDMNTRWGYDELKRALSGEEIEIVDNFVYSPPATEFYFNDEKFTQVPPLAKAFAENWEDAKIHLRDNSFLEFVDNCSEGIYSNVVNCLKIEDSDFALFNLIYTLDDTMPLCWKGNSYSNFENFCEGMLLAFNKDAYNDLMINGILSEYATIQGMDDNLISNLKRLEEEAKLGINSELVANKLDFILSDNYVYKLGDNEFEGVNSLVSYIQENVNSLDDICSELLEDVRFFAWLEILGYNEQIQEWRNEL